MGVEGIRISTESAAGHQGWLLLLRARTPRRLPGAAAAAHTARLLHPIFCSRTSTTGAGASSLTAGILNELWVGCCSKMKRGRAVCSRRAPLCAGRRRQSNSSTHRCGTTLAAARGSKKSGALPRVFVYAGGAHKLPSRSPSRLQLPFTNRGGLYIAGQQIGSPLLPAALCCCLSLASGKTQNPSSSSRRRGACGRSRRRSRPLGVLGVARRELLGRQRAPHADHRVARHEARERRLVPAISAGRALGGDNVALCRRCDVKGGGCGVLFFGGGMVWCVTVVAG